MARISLPPDVAITDDPRRSIYLARHGSIARPQGGKVFIGQSDLDLDPSGHRQAESLAARMRRIPLSAIYTSDLQRCVATARYIADGRNLSPIQMPQFREIHLGEWEGISFETIRKNHPDAFIQRGKDFARFRPPGGESFADLNRRVFPTLDHIMATTVGDILIVAHAGVNRVILARAMGLDLNELFKIPQEYGCLNRVVYAPD